MSDTDSPGATLEAAPKRRPSRLSELGDRIARTFGNVDRVKRDPPAWAPAAEDEYPAAEEATAAWEQAQPPFRIVRHGYEPAAVDDYISELEQELETLRARTPDERVVAEEIDRIGEQTAAILRVAHDKAQEVTREAQAQADKCVADAAANALAITENANRRVHDIDAETDSIWHERARLVEDVRAVAAALFSVAEDAAARYPAEPEKAHRQVTASAEPPRAEVERSDV